MRGPTSSCDRFVACAVLLGVLFATGTSAAGGAATSRLADDAGLDAGTPEDVGAGDAGAAEAPDRGAGSSAGPSADAGVPPAATPEPKPVGRPAYDLILSNGRIVDGTGAPWFPGDVGILRGRIVAIGNLSHATARRRVDVQKKIIAPGFIDLLGQSEFNALVDGRCASKITQGITTEFTGEGTSVWPLDPQQLAHWKPWNDKHKLKIDWKDLAGYGQRFNRSHVAINLGTFVGAASVRQAVLGWDDVQPTPEQLTKMERLTDEAMRQGAFGLATALIYPPATFSKTEELIALAKVAAKHGGLYATHLRSERGDKELQALDEAFRIGREAGVPVEIWHLKAAGRVSWGRMPQLLQKIQEARDSGVDVGADMYPYEASSNALTSDVPEWAQAGGVDEMLRRFHDPELRPKILAEMFRGEGAAEIAHTILLVHGISPEVKPFLGKRLDEVAKELNLSIAEAVLRIVELDRGQTIVVRFGMSDDDVRAAIANPLIALGSDNPAQAVDGPFAGESAHPRGFGAAARWLGHYGRDLKLFSLEEGVRRMTSLPARRVGLWDRGLLRPGLWADIVVFDPEKLRDTATYEAPLQYAEGVTHVVVNGKLVLDDGKFTKNRPGKFLKHPIHAPQAWR